MIDKTMKAEYYQVSATNRLIKMISDKARERKMEVPELNCEEDVLANLYLLTKFGSSENLDLETDKVKFLPLECKKLVFRMLYPNGRWEVETPVPSPYGGERGGFLCKAVLYDGNEVIARQETYFNKPDIEEGKFRVTSRNTKDGEVVEKKVARLWYQYPDTTKCFPTYNACYANAIAGIQGRTLTRAFATLGIGYLEFDWNGEDNSLSYEFISDKEEEETEKKIMKQIAKKEDEEKASTFASVTPVVFKASEVEKAKEEAKTEEVKEELTKEELTEEQLNFHNSFLDEI